MDPEKIKIEITTLLEKMGLESDVEGVEIHQGLTSRFVVRVNNAAVFNLDPESGPGLSLTNLLIGEHGGNLAALEHLLKKIVKKKYGEDQKLTLDINDYRTKRLEDLKQDVKAAAKAVRLYRKEVPLRPMSSFERRVVHLLLAEYPDITTESIGQEPDRRVIIKPYP